MIHPPPGDSSPSGGGMGKFALLATVGMMFPVSITVGAGFGYLLDRWLGTSPWLLLLFTGLGIAAAIINLIRVLQKFDEAS